MKLAVQILSASEREHIHEQSLRILSEVGVRFHGRLAPQILQQHGVPWEAETKTARIPQEIVEQALASTPKRFSLGARNPQFSVELPAGKSYYAIDGTAAFTQDFHTGERRYGTAKDIEESLRVFQRLELGKMAWAPVAATDTPAHVRALREFFLMARFSSKHGQHELHSAAQAPYLAEGLALIMGGEQKLRESSAYSLIYCPVAPLTHDGEMLDAYLELGAWNLPVMMMPMPVCGTTGPASLYSNIALANAEALSSIVIFELAHPGRALIYASATGVVDFRSGAYLAGVPEIGIMSGALTEMGKFYGMPTGSAGMTSDAKQPGAQACIEKLITTLPAVLAGSDLIVGLGEIESDQLLVLEQLIVDHEIARLVERLAAGVDGAVDKELFEDIQTVGPGGHFLKSKNTRRLAHSDEFYYSKLIDHSPYEAWVGLGKPEMYTKARAEVERILAEPLADPLPETVINGLDEIIKKAERELSVE
jgi:trimethylamine--corrinoid protein Co-methyltransferase